MTTVRSPKAVLSSLVLAGFALVAVSGCTFSANLTVPPETVASAAADALEQQVGTRPNIDCGTEQVDLVNDTVVPCVLSVDGETATYDAPVTISNVDGTKFSVSVQVAETPRA